MAHKVTQYYFLGIGGIGMSALARYFFSKGYAVAGYDKTPGKNTKNLITDGIAVCFDDAVDAIPEAFRNPDKTMVITTPAVPIDNKQFQYFTENGFSMKKRSVVLGEITKQNKAICVAGTHGKTTTSTMTAHLMHQSSVECSAFLGGISNNYNSNLILSDQSNYVVVEADEYDRSFHHLTPFMAVITSMDPDHLDIYGTKEAFVESFEHFTSLISTGGALIAHEHVELTPRLAKGVKFYRYGLSSKSDFYADNVIVDNGKMFFDFVTPTETIHNIRLGVPIMINVENAVAAMALAWLNGVTNDEMRASMAAFSGIYRRFDFVYQNDQVVFMDDYAHHPNELKASIASVRKLFPDREITGIFQPHLYTRTRDFAPEFAAALSGLDALILLDIYPARELPIEGVDSNLILQGVKIENKVGIQYDQLLEELKHRDLDVVVTFGAGDIEMLVPEIKKLIKSKYRKPVVQ